MGLSITIGKDTRLEVCGWDLVDGTTWSVDNMDTVTATLRDSTGTTITSSSITLTRIGTTNAYAGVYPSFLALVENSPVDVVVTVVMSDTDVTTRRKVFHDILPKAA